MYKPNSEMQSDTSLTPEESAAGKSKLYDLLSQLFISGPDETLVPLIAAVDELAHHFPADSDPSIWGAAHHNVFGLSIFPHESYFLDASGMLGGPLAETVAQRYGQLGYKPPRTVAAVDHLGVELGLMSFLCGAEADALRDGLIDVAERMKREQARFLADHLLRWIAPVTWAIYREGDPFYSAVASLVPVLAADHADAFAAVPREPLMLPAGPDLLDEKSTSLREIAAYLMTPAHSGLFLSRTTVSHIARALHLPRGFADRTQMLTNLFQAAAQYEQIPLLLASLKQTVEDASATYEQILAEQPLCSFAVRPWQEKLAQTQRMLTQIEEQTSVLHE